MVHTAVWGLRAPRWVWEAQPPGLCMGEKRPQALGGEQSDTSIQEGFLERDENTEAQAV